MTLSKKKIYLYGLKNRIWVMERKIKELNMYIKKDKEEVAKIEKELKNERSKKNRSNN